MCKYSKGVSIAENHSVLTNSESCKINKSNVVYSVVRTLIDNDSRHHSGQNVVRQVSPQQILTTVMTNIVVDKSTDNAKPHSIYFLPQYQRQRKFLQ